MSYLQKSKGEMMRILKSSVLCAAVLAVAFSGCAEKKVCKTAIVAPKTEVVATSTVDTRDSEIRNLQAELSEARAKSAKVVTVTKEVAGPNELYPPNAEPGKCYARVLNPAKYEMQTEKVLKQEAGERVVVTPATYAMETKKILVKEAGERLVTIPATYKTVTEKVLVKEASERLVKVPATYAKRTEKILVRDAYTTWKKGSGPQQRVDHATGEIVCLVEVPAQYKTVTTRVIKTPASVKSIPVPAVYKTVKRQVIANSASTKSIPVPAVYKTVKTKVVKTPASSSSIAIPATYQTVTKRIKVSDAVLKWQEVKCKTVK